MSDPTARWALVGTLLIAFAFVAPGIALAVPAAGPVAVGPGVSVVFGNGHGNGGGSGHGGGSFTCPRVTGAGTSVCSTNWAGYADTGSAGSVTAVSGSWTVPALHCPSHGTTYVAIWVGIDGYTSGTVEQTGTMGVCSHGAASYSAWYEFYPNPSVTFPGTVRAGDAVHASVTYSGGQYSVSLTIGTGSAQTASATVATAQATSAEWVAERPALCSPTNCRLTTLANFGSAAFTSASATLSGTTGSISAFPPDVAITMVGSTNGPVLAQPTALAAGGASFTVNYV